MSFLVQDDCEKFRENEISKHINFDAKKLLISMPIQGLQKVHENAYYKKAMQEFQRFFFLYPNKHF